MRKLDYAGRRRNDRRAKARLWADRDNGHGVFLNIENMCAVLTPASAYKLANQLVDAAERAETLGHRPASATDRR